MKPISNHTLIWFVCLSVTISIVQSGHGASVPFQEDLPPLPLNDQPQKASRLDLLDLGFQTASAIRIQPHVKDRSRAQEMIVGACLELDQPQRAMRYLVQIANWRQGMAWADLAFYAVGRDQKLDLEPLLQRAEAFAQSADQDWRRERVLARVAQVRALLGQTEQARRIAQSLQTDSERVVVAESPEARVAELDQLLQSGNFDLMVTAVRGYIELYRQSGADGEGRAMAERQVKAGSAKMPMDLQIGFLLQLSAAAAGQERLDDARRLVDEAQSKLDGHKWLVEAQIPLMAEVARHRHLAGQTDAGRTLLQAARGMFDQSRERIQSFERAGALRPVAEAYVVMNDPDSALAVYRLAIEEGAVNPNARPRAEDLVATCRSMALVGVEPDQELWARMKAIQQGLGDPW